MQDYPSRDAWNGAALPGNGPAWATAQPPAQTPAPASSSFAPPPPPPPQSLLYELRPLSIGEILDRSFALYRRRFWLFAGISSITAAISTVSTFVRLTWGFTGFPGLDGTAANAQPDLRGVLISTLVSFVTAVLFLLTYGVTQAATASAFASVYLGQQTSIGEAARAVGRHWFRYVLIILWQAVSVFWIPFLVMIPAFALLAMGGESRYFAAFLFVAALVVLLVWGAIAYLRNSLGIVASAIEDLPVPRAMKRSKQLVANRKGRVFAVYLMLYVLALAAAAVQGTFAVLMAMSHSAQRVLLEALTLLATFASSTLVAPVGIIALCLIYFDERVRREGLDLDILMDRVLGPMSAPPPSSPYAPPPFSPYGEAPAASGFGSLGFAGSALPPSDLTTSAASHAALPPSELV